MTPSFSRQPLSVARAQREEQQPAMEHLRPKGGVGQAACAKVIADVLTSTRNIADSTCLADHLTGADAMFFPLKAYWREW